MGYARHVYHIYAIRTAHRQAWQEALLADGVQTGIHYPTPVHLLPAFAALGLGRGAFPHSERAADEVLSLPMFPELTESQCVDVSKALLRHVSSRLAETKATRSAAQSTTGLLT